MARVKQNKPLAAADFKPPLGVLRKRLREAVVEVLGTKFYLRCLNGDQLALAQDEAYDQTGGKLTLATLHLKVVKYACFKVEDLKDEDGDSVDVEMDDYSLNGQVYKCLPDDILNLLPPSIIAHLFERANEISSLAAQEKKESSSTGGSERQESDATQEPAA